MPEARTLHIDKTLTDFSLKYRNEQMIWPAVFPAIKVEKRSDKYMKYNKADSYRLIDDKIGPKSMANEGDWGVSTGNYSVKDHAFADWLPQEAIDNADNPLTPEIDTVDFINMMLDIAQERRVSSAVFNSSNYASAQKTTLSGTSQWGQSADDPIGNLITAVESCFIRANTLVIGADAWMILRKLPELLDAVKGSTRYQGSPGGLVQTGELAGLLELENVLVGRGRYISSAEGQTETYARLWGKHAVACYVVSNPGVKSITFGATFVETPRQIQRDFDIKRGIKGAHYIKGVWNSDEQFIAADLGYMIENAVP